MSPLASSQSLQISSRRRLTQIPRGHFTRSQGRQRRQRVFRLLVGLALGAAALLLGGCGPIGNVVSTTQALDDGGFQAVSVGFGVSNPDRLEVNVHVAASATASDANDVARIVWDSFHERFSMLQVSVHGIGPAYSQRYSFEELVAMFGARNQAWNRTSLAGAVEQMGALVIGVVLLLGAAVVFLAVRVSRRRRRSSWPLGGPLWGYRPGPGSGQPGWPPPAAPPPSHQAPPGRGDPPPGGGT